MAHLNYYLDLCSLTLLQVGDSVELDEMQATDSRLRPEIYRYASLALALASN